MGSFQLWEYAVETPSGFKCEFCGEEYAGNTTRLMWHLARIEGHDINICPLVSEDVQKEAYAYATIEEIHSRKRVSSSTDAFLSSKCTRISNPTNGIDAATATPSSSMKNWGPVGTYPPVKTMGDRLLITEIVGKQFNKYINDIWFCLMDDDVLKCGICGAGGVGKTEVAKHINNLLLRVPNKFHHVFWVNASPDWSILNQATLSPHYRIHKMQSLISKAVGVDLSDGDDENKRAAQLFKVLTEKKKCVVILDDVWDYISLEGVGIPVGVDQCTVVVTTRSLEVCRQLNCQRRIEIECLMPDESYELYRKILGKDTTLSEESEKISNSIVDKCGGLPLAITIMARNMRGITDAGRLRSALDGYMWKKAVAEIFQKLKLSYDYLKDPTLQHCFLYCPLFVGEGYRTLEMFLVHEGILKRMTSRRKELDEANTMVKILQDACLLEIDDDYLVQMNEMIRSMALQIMEENQQRVMIKGGMSLQVLPDVGSWTEDLVRVSLTESTRIENIPLNYSPSCSKLSTLLLTGNLSLTYIGDSFFEGLPGLKVLCLSETRIESLPVSLFGLVNLTTLLLFKCEKLRKIPSVAKLRALKTLDLSFSGLEEVPDDIEMLLELKHLDLFESQVKELKSGIFANLSYMQFLSLYRHRDRNRDRSGRREHGRDRVDDDSYRSRNSDRHRDYDRDREDRHRRRSRSPGRSRSEHRSKSRSPSRSRSTSKRISGFDMAPQPSSLFSPATVAAGPNPGVNPPIPGMFPNMMLGAGQFGALAAMPVHAMTQQATRHARRVYVGGLLPTANEQSVATFFSQVMAAIGGNTAGPGDAVVNVYINHEKKFAFVEMRSVEEASNAMALDGIIFEGAPVKVRRPSDYNPSLAATLGPSQPNPNLNLAAVGLNPGSASGGLEGPDRIFVGGLPYYFTEAQVRELLESFGPLRGFDLVKDRETGNSKGYAFCVYQDLSVTDIACAALNGIKMGDKTLTVRRANQGSNQPKPEQENVLLHAQQQVAIQRLMLQPVPTKVVCLTEVVNPDELNDNEEYEDILEDMRMEGQKFGTLVNVVIPRPRPDGEAAPGVGKVFLEYADIEGASKARAGMNGRKFGGNQVVAVFYQETKFYQSEYDG